MGTVFEAQHLRLCDRTVAVKMLNPTAQSDMIMLMRFRQEAEIISSLRHPNIVRILDFNVLPDGKPYLVMEYLRGEDLENRARRCGGRLPLKLVLDILRQVACGLSALHKRGIVHRDLKPGNVLLTDVPGAGTAVKLLDFGLSKILDAGYQLTRDLTLVGTANFCSPEQISDRHEIDHRADIFALGVMAFWALSGELPFKDRSILNVMHRVCFGDRPSLVERAAHLPPEVDPVILKALAVAPDERYQQVDQFITDLEDALDLSGDWPPLLDAPAMRARHPEPQRGPPPPVEDDELPDLTDEVELMEDEDDPEEHKRTTRLERNPFLQGRIAVPVALTGEATECAARAVTSGAAPRLQARTDRWVLIVCCVMIPLSSALAITAGIMLFWK